MMANLHISLQARWQIVAWFLGGWNAQVVFQPSKGSDKKQRLKCYSAVLLSNMDIQSCVAWQLHMCLHELGSICTSNFTLSSCCITNFQVLTLATLLAVKPINFHFCY
jgi:hypothetical protein